MKIVGATVPADAVCKAVAKNAVTRLKQSADSTASAEKVLALEEPEIALRDTDCERRHRAVSALGATLDERLAGRVASLLGDDMAVARSAAAESLGMMGVAVAGPHVLSHLSWGGTLGENGRNRVAAAADAIVFIGHGILPAVVTLLIDGEAGVRAAAKHAITSTLRDVDGSRRLRAGQVLGDLLEEEEKDHQGFGAALASVLVGLLGDSDLRVRRRSATILRGARAKTVIPALVGAIRSSDCLSLHENAAQLLSVIGAPLHATEASRDDARSHQSVDDILEAILDDSERQVDIPSPHSEAVVTILNALGRPLQSLQPNTEEAAALLTHHDADVKAAAAKLVGSDTTNGFRHVAALATLAACTDEGSGTDHFAANAAVAALSQLGSDGSLALQRLLRASSDPAEAARVANLMSRMNHESSRHLVPVLFDRYGHAPTVGAYAAAQVLCCTDDFDNASMRAIARLAQEDVDATVRTAAMDALTWASGFGVPEAVLQYEELRSQARLLPNDVGAVRKTQEEATISLNAEHRTRIVMTKDQGFLAQTSTFDQKHSVVSGRRHFEAVAVLSNLAESSSPVTRGAAAMTLGMTAGSAELSAGQKGGAADNLWRLIVLLKDEHADVRRSAAEALGQAQLGSHRKAVADAMVPLLADPIASVRAASATSLASLGKDGARHAAAVATLLRDRVASVRSATISALAVLCEPDAAAQAAVYLTDSMPEARSSAATALAAMGPVALPRAPDVAALLADVDSVVQQAAVDALARMRAGAVQAGALLEHPEFIVRDYAVRAIGALGVAGASQAAARLTHCDASVQCSALAALGAASAHEAMVQTRSHAVCDGKAASKCSVDVSDRYAASVASMLSRPRRVADRRQDRWQVRLEALRALSRMGPAATLHAPKIALLLCDREAEVRAEAAMVIAQLVILGKESRTGD